MTNTNSLTRAVIKFIQSEGHQAERISVEGRVIAKTRTVNDYLMGGTRKATTYKRVRSSMQRGTADISATIFGKSVKIEIKVGRDKQSDYQRRYQEQVERAGGVYMIIRDMDQFLAWYEAISGRRVR